MEIPQNTSYSPYLTPQQKQSLADKEHVFDFALSESDLQFLDENGYLVVKNLVEDELIDTIVKQSFERCTKIFELDVNDESSWGKAISRFGLVDLWHIPSFYQLRQHPKVYSLFAQLLKTHKLCVSIDRVSMKHPCTDPKTTNKDLQLHTDLNYWTVAPNFIQYQGGLCLQDCPAGGGGFYCIPGFHKRENIDRYKRDWEQGKFGNSTVIPKADKFFIPFDDQEFTNAHKKEIPLKKGEFVIWNGNLPHNGGNNTLPNQWRLQTFVRFLALDGPCVSISDIKWAIEYRNLAAATMKSGERPSHFSTGNRIKIGKKDFETAVHREPSLSSLGEKIWGLQPWDHKPSKQKKVQKG